jgi:hypothetical protein
MLGSPHIRFLPHGADVVCQFSHSDPLIIGDRLAIFVVQVYGVHELAIYVKLLVESCPITNTYWARAAVTIKVGKLNLW